MCRNIKTLFNFEPSKANEEAFERAVEEAAAVARTLIASLVTASEPRNREVEAAKARARMVTRFGESRRV